MFPSNKVCGKFIGANPKFNPKVPPNFFELCMEKQSIERFEIQTVTKEEVLKTIKSMSNKISEGNDGILIKLLKKLANDHKRINCLY